MITPETYSFKRLMAEDDARCENASIKTMWFEGHCPFLTCLIQEGHCHNICPECQGVRYGRLFCQTCVAFHLKLEEYLKS